MTYDLKVVVLLDMLFVVVLWEFDVDQLFAKRTERFVLLFLGGVTIHII